jgi:hypothetical protein
MSMPLITTNQTQQNALAQVRAEAMKPAYQRGGSDAALLRSKRRAELAGCDRADITEVIRQANYDYDVAYQAAKREAHKGE